MKKYYNFLSKDEIKEILNWLDTQPYSKEATVDHPGLGNITKFRNKNLDFHLDNSPVRRIVFPKLQKIIESAEPTHCSFLESHYPFTLHVDTVSTFDKHNFYATKNTSTDVTVLIALNESPDFQTVFFDFYADNLDEYYDKLNNKLPESATPLPKLDYPGVNDLSHIPVGWQEFLLKNDIKCVNACTWKEGFAMVWPRRQLHCSSNFLGKGIKQALVLFF
jgi:hypothetical protein